MQKLYFLINPRSGGALGGILLRRLSQMTPNGSYTVEVEALSFAEKEHQLAKARSSDVVVIGGGDGTISTMVGELRGAPCRIGVLPLGTGNDFARELGIFRGTLPLSDPDSLCRFYLTSATQRVTVWTFEYGEGFSSVVPFLNYVSMGFDAKVVADFSAWRSSVVGRYARGVLLNRLAYSLAGLKNIFYQLTAPLKIKSREEDFTISSARGVIFANIRSIMGMAISNPVGSAFDETVECIVVRSILEYIAMVSHFRIPFLHPRIMKSGTEWDISDVPERVSFQIDGEPRGDIVTTRFRIRPAGNVQIIAPARA